MIENITAAGGIPLRREKVGVEGRKIEN